MISVSAHAIPHDLGQNLGSAPPGKFQIFEDQDASAFTDYESVARDIPRTTGFFGSIVPRGKRSHCGESAHAHGSDGGFRAARDHHVRVATRDDLVSVAYRMRARGTSGAGSFVRSLSVIADADVSGGQIHNGGWNEKRGDFTRPAVQQIAVLALYDIEPTNSGSNMHAYPGGHVRCDFEAGAFHGFIRGRHCQVDKAAHLFQFFFLDKLQRVEIFDFRRDAAGELRRIKLSDRGYATLARAQVAPHFLGRVAYATNQANASDYNPTSQLLPAFRVLPDVINRILHGTDFLRVFIGNLNFEGFFEGHD